MLRAEHGAISALNLRLRECQRLIEECEVMNWPSGVTAGLGESGVLEQRTVCDVHDAYFLGTRRLSLSRGGD